MRDLIFSVAIIVTYPAWMPALWLMGQVAERRKIWRMNAGGLDEL